MNKILYDIMMMTKVEADVYSGEHCDEVSKHFMTHCKDEMDEDAHTDDIIISLKDLPAGAQIIVEYPCCPDCGIARLDTFKHDECGRSEIIGHDSKCDCGFDWNNWVLDTYA